MSARHKPAMRPKNHFYRCLETSKDIGTKTRENHVRTEQIFTQIGTRYFFHGQKMQQVHIFPYRGLPWDYQPMLYGTFLERADVEL